MPRFADRTLVREWLNSGNRGAAKLAQDVTQKIDACRRADSFDGSSNEMKAKSAAENGCVRERVEAESLALQKDQLEPAHILTLRRDLIKNVCDLTEEAQWVDFATTSAMLQGSMYGFTFLGCMAGSYDEQLLLLRSIREGDLAIAIERVRETRPRGAYARKLMECRLRELRTTREPPPSKEECFIMCPLRGETRKKLIKLFDDVLNQSKKLGSDACSAAPKLQSALGDDCPAAIADYIAQRYYERDE